MKPKDKIRSFYTVADIANLPVTGQLGWAYVVQDDGTGKVAIAIWDVAAGSWAITYSGSGGGGGDWQASVLSQAVNDPSTLSPSVGERWIVAAGGVGVWSGKDNDIAEWDGVTWDYTTPNEGTTCEVEDEDQYYTFNGVIWVNSANFLLHSSLTGLGNDDHTQYHNNTRGDARYWVKTIAASPPGAPVDGELWYFTTNDMLMKYDADRAKWLSAQTFVVQFGKAGITPSGAYFLADGFPTSPTRGYYIPYNATIVGISLNRKNGLATNISIEENGVEKLATATAALKVKDMAVNVDLATDTTIAFRNKSGGGDVLNLNGLLFLKWRQ